MSNQKTLEQFINEGRPPGAPKFYSLNFLAEGDSWMNISYIAGVGEVRNMLDPLTFPKDYVIVNVAKSGDTVVQMQQFYKNPNFIKALTLRKWDLIFLSGGGNDLIDAIHGEYLINNRLISILRKLDTAPATYEDYIDSVNFELVLENIKQCYITIAGQRLLAGKGENKDIKIITHCYDHITAREAPFRVPGLGISIGPWVIRGFQQNGIDKEYWADIQDHIFKKFESMMLSLQQIIPNFIVLDTYTKAVLTLADPKSTGDSKDWANEIHPNAKGFTKFTKAHLQPLVDKLFSESIVTSETTKRAAKKSTKKAKKSNVKK